MREREGKKVEEETVLKIERERGRKTDRLSNSKKPGQTNRHITSGPYRHINR